MKIEKVPSQKQMVLQGRDREGRFLLQVFYVDEGHQFEIRVINMATQETRTSFKDATYRPFFGIDALDQTIVLAEAEAMCEDWDKAEKELIEDE